MTYDHNQIRQIVFKPGDILFRENDHSFQFYILQDGIVEIYKTSPEGNKIILAEATEGTSIGEFAMIDRRPRSATAQAKTTVTAIEVSEEGYQKLLSELPDWAVAVMRGLVERLRNANEIIRRIQQEGGVSQKSTQEIASTEYDPEASSVTKTPFDFDDTPDLA